MKSFCVYFYLFSGSVLAQEFLSFPQAKKYLIQALPTNSETLYCGCIIKKKGKKLIPDPTSCGYEPRNELTKKGNINVRAKRIEWEHIVPAWELGHQLQCWQNGGRKNCIKVSDEFRRMEADINNLAPVIGEINGDRSNFRFGMISGESRKYGACDVEIDFKQRVIEPPPASRKRIAEAYLYMKRTYGLKISKKQERLFLVWKETKQ